VVWPPPAPHPTGAGAGGSRRPLLPIPPRGRCGRGARAGLRRQRRAGSSRGRSRSTAAGARPSSSGHGARPSSSSSFSSLAGAPHLRPPSLLSPSATVSLLPDGLRCSPGATATPHRRSLHGGSLPTGGSLHLMAPSPVALCTAADARDGGPGGPLHGGARVPLRGGRAGPWRSRGRGPGAPSRPDPRGPWRRWPDPRGARRLLLPPPPPSRAPEQQCMRWRREGLQFPRHFASRVCVVCWRTCLA